jgi:hypothetical protein
MMRNGHVVLMYFVLVCVILERFLSGPLSKIKEYGDTQEDEPPRYSPGLQQAGRDAETMASCFFPHRLTLEDHLLSNHLKLGSLVPHPLGRCQGRQEGVLQRHGGVWSRTRCALLGSTS